MLKVRIIKAVYIICCLYHYWPNLFGQVAWILISFSFALLLTSNLSRFTKTQKRNWSITHVYWQSLHGKLWLEKYLWLTFIATSGFKSINSLFFLECYNFTSLTDADRKPSFHLVESGKHDTNLGPGWFRFQGDAGSMMTTSCPPRERCNTIAPGWLRDTHPEVTDGIVTRQVCFSYNAGCCEWKTQIQVRNCQWIHCILSSQYTISKRTSPLLRQWLKWRRSAYT